MTPDTSSQSWTTFGGVVLTGGIATAANLVRGPAGWAFAGVACLVGVSILGSTSLGWPFPSLKEEPLERLRLKAIRVANQLQRCASDQGPRLPFNRHSPYGLTATVAKALANAPKVTRRSSRQLRYTRRLARRLPRIIEELANSGLIDDALAPYVTTRPEPREMLYVASTLSKVANGPVRGAEMR